MHKVGMVILGMGFLGIVFFAGSYVSAKTKEALTLQRVLNKKITIYEHANSLEGEDISRRKIKVPQTVIKVSKSGNRFLISTPKGKKWVDSFEVQILQERDKKLSGVKRSREKSSGGRGIAD